MCDLGAGRHMSQYIIRGQLSGVIDLFPRDQTQAVRLAQWILYSLGHFICPCEYFGKNLSSTSN